MPSTHPIHHSPMVETLEHIRALSRFPEWHWCDVLGISWSEYQKIKVGHSNVPQKALESLTKEFPLSLEELFSNQVDFRELAMLAEDPKKEMPERYLQAPFGRRRASIASLDYLEGKYGWRLRTSILRWLDVPERQLTDPFAPISINLMSDICSFLTRCGLGQKDFYQMGIYSYDAAKNSIIGETLSSLKSVSEAFECSLTDLILIYEKNCLYRLTKLSKHYAEFEMSPNKDAADALKSEHVGTADLCSYKSGHFAAIPLYLRQAPARVFKKSCMFEGSPSCRFEVHF